MKSILFYSVILSLLSGCSTQLKKETKSRELSSLTEVCSEKIGISPYSTREPSTHIFKNAEKSITFVAAKHTAEQNSPTFQEIEKALQDFDFNLLIIESPILSNRGWSQGRFVHESKKNLRYFGESGFAAILSQNISPPVPFESAEPTDEALKTELLSYGFKVEDVLGYYFARSLKRSRPDTNLEEAFQRRIPQFKQSLGLNEVAFELGDFKNWYQSANGKEFALPLDRREFRPSTDGQFRTQRIMASINSARDRHIFSVIAKRLESHQRILMVYGMGHFDSLKDSLSCLISE